MSRTAPSPPRRGPGVGQPLVTIGIPTYERPHQLERAMRSALAQDYLRIEVLVSDNASSDAAVGQVASRIAAEDPRLRYVRQPQNLGAVNNFRWVLEAAVGDYFMWLSDDDWLDPGYVGRCLDALRDDGANVLVCGVARYYRDEAHVIDERPIDLGSTRPGLRIIRFFSRVNTNGTLFGVACREHLATIGYPSGLGGDWHLMAALAARGRVRTVAGVHIHRSMTGSGSDTTSLARSLGMRGIAARQHHLVLAGRLWRDIALTGPAFGGMNQVPRLCVATTVAALVVVRFTLVGLVRRALGFRIARSVEARASAWLRARDSRGRGHDAL